MQRARVLFFTDVVDSTAVTERLGDQRASALWSDHDRRARSLLRRWRGREIDKSDGFLLMFDEVADAVGFALELHEALAGLQPPLRCRSGMHRCELVLRQPTEEDLLLGAKPLEVDGVGKAIAARLMALAEGGQTLLSAEAARGLIEAGYHVTSHGHWRLKGIAEPIEVFEVARDGAPLVPPADAAKAYRVVLQDGLWRPAASIVHSLPVERDAFVGRQRELQALAGRFDAEHRLVSVVGEGGIGKTRLVLRFAHGWLGSFPGGAWFCDLGAARDLDGIARAVATGLRTTLGRGDPIEQISSVLAARGTCLLMLDNFEQVASLAEATLGSWMDAAPQARLLITSREVLQVKGEEPLRLDPLPRGDAARLYELRASMHDAETAGGNSEALMSLVALLDGLPLAIELAAARSDVLSPEAMAVRLRERVGLLSLGGRRLDRQSTLRATLDWSWELLTPIEQRTMAELSVFEDGFDIRAAEAVVDHPLGGDLVDLVQQLVLKSWLRSSQSRRLGMLRSVHEYAAERLGDDSGGARRRHWAYFAHFSEDEATRDRSAELGNLVAACRRAAAHDRRSAVSALEGAWAAIRLVGPFRAGLELARQIEASGSLALRELAVVTSIQGAALSLTGCTAEAAMAYERALAAARSAGDDALMGRVCRLTADLASSLGRLDDADRHLQEAARLAEASADGQGRCLALSGHGTLRLKQGRLDEARDCYERALSMASDRPMRRWRGGLHGNLGVVAQLQGRLAEALRHYGTALDLARDLGDLQWEGNSRCNLGWLLHEMGDDRSALGELGHALRIARSMGHRRLEATALCNLGIVEDALGEDVSAGETLGESVRLAEALGDLQMVSQFRGYLGEWSARNGEAAAATDHFTFALRHLPEGDATAKGLLAAQQASAFAAQGNLDQAREWLARTEAILGPLALPTHTEPMRVLRRAVALINSRR